MTSSGEAWRPPTLPPHFWTGETSTLDLDFLPTAHSPPAGAAAAEDRGRYARASADARGDPAAGGPLDATPLFEAGVAGNSPQRRSSVCEPPPWGWLLPSVPEEDGALSAGTSAGTSMATSGGLSRRDEFVDVDGFGDAVGDDEGTSPAAAAAAAAAGAAAASAANAVAAAAAAAAASGGGGEMFEDGDGFLNWDRAPYDDDCSGSPEVRRFFVEVVVVAGGRMHTARW